MSRQQKSTQARTPFCKVCKDAGKPEAIYTSHYVKEKTGKVCCTTLLTQECRYCGQLGHTVKFCEILAHENKQKEANRRREENRIKELRAQQAAKQQSAKPKQPMNRFEDLSEDSEGEDAAAPKAKATPQAKPTHQVKTSTVEEFPALTQMQNVTLRPHQMNWADAVTKPDATPAPAPAPAPVPVPRSNARQRFIEAALQQKRMSWADIESDSDDEPYNPEDYRLSFAPKDSCDAADEYEVDDEELIERYMNDDGDCWRNR
jgi:hypothetical protein